MGRDREEGEGTGNRNREEGAQLCREVRNERKRRARTSDWSPPDDKQHLLCPEGVFFVSHWPEEAQSRSTSTISAAREEVKG